MAAQPVLIAGEWRKSDSAGEFQAENPASGTPLADVYPVSSWSDLDAALDSAVVAAKELNRTPPAKIAAFLERHAERIQNRADELVALANAETGYPVRPRLAEVELPRTVGQLRQAAAAALEGSWALPTIDVNAGIRSLLTPIGPVAVFGPNNFPFAFGSASGGDYAAAIAAGNPVIAKANTSHPGVTRLFAEEAREAARETGLPPGTVQLIYRMSHQDGMRLVSDRRLGASAYTGSRSAGLALKGAADQAGKPIYLELSSVNPVVILPGALRERREKIVTEFTSSCLMGAGQFCTNPGLVLLLAAPETEAFVADVVAGFSATPAGVLLSANVARSLVDGVRALLAAGAEKQVGGAPLPGPGYRFENTLLRVSGQRFLANSLNLQEEAFGNVSLFVVARSIEELTAIVDRLDGNLTGCVYSSLSGEDDSLYDRVAPHLRPKVGRLLNDKMPTGVAVSPAMNHGGPYPSTGHPGFTAVGIPASLRRFAMLACYDGVRPERLPPALRDKNPNGRVWRSIDGVWTQGDVGAL